MFYTIKRKNVQAKCNYMYPIDNANTITMRAAFKAFYRSPERKYEQERRKFIDN